MSGPPPRGKALPARPSQDMEYGNQGGYGRAQNGYNENVDPRNYGPPTLNGRKGIPEPNGRVVLEGYRNDIINGFEEKARYNPLNSTRPQSSVLLNVNDPIQIHLLVETALGDSKEFEILSQEEVDDLKKQCQALTQRIEQTRQNLAIQSKYRDAAISMAKLYSPTDKKKSLDADGKRRSMFGHNRNSSDSVNEADQERLASEKKCEDLAAELWSLEKRLLEPQSRLLKHTAGILQMTHKGPKKTPKGQGAQQQGIPGSPESMYTYSNARSSLEPIHDELNFDERSLYRNADNYETFDIGAPVSKGPSKEQMEMIANMERKLEDLNSKLREVIIKTNPDTTHRPPPVAKLDKSGKPAEAGSTLQSHLEYLERSIDAIDHESAAQSSRVQEQSEAAMEETLEELNGGIHAVLLPYDLSHPGPPELTGTGLNEQLEYFQEVVGAVQEELSRAATTANKGVTTQGNMEQMQTVMMGLWDIIQSGEEDQRQRKQERRKTRMAQNVPEDDEESPDEGDAPNESFSIQGFSSKVQWLYSQATRLKDQKKVLQRQIKQQRELNNKSDATKDAEIVQKVEELQRTQDLLTRTEADSNNVREQLSDMMEKLDEARQKDNLRDQARSNDESAAVRQAQEELQSRAQTIRQVQEDLKDREQTIADLEEELQDLKDDRSIAAAELQGKTADLEVRITALNQELTTATATHAMHQKGIQEKELAISSKEKEMEEANMEIARLQTEVTIARAELDGAYGSRAQRAAEVAGNPAIQKEIDDLSRKNVSLAAELEALQQKGTANPETEKQMQTLKTELAETIEEYEQMTKASIEWEKEREQLEGTIDKLRDEREGLEAQLSDEKVRWLGVRSPGLDGGAGPGPGMTSTTVLKNEFKKMMRDTRAESLKALRAEQAERRRVEDELRALKKAQGPGKSSLSQSMGA